MKQMCTHTLGNDNVIFSLCDDDDSVSKFILFGQQRHFQSNVRQCLGCEVLLFGKRLCFLNTLFKWH